MNHISKSTVFIACFGVSACFAQDISPSKTALEPIEVSAKKTTFASVSYKSAAEQLARITKLSDGMIGFGLLVERTNASVDLQGLEAWIEDDKQSLKLPVLPGGVIRFLAGGAVDESRAVIVVNREPGSLRPKALVFFPVVDRSNLTMKSVRKFIEKGVVAMREIRPALLRWSAPKDLSFSVCQSQTGGQVVGELDGKTVMTFALDTPSKDDAGRDVFCKRFGTKDDVPDDLTLRVPPHAQLLLLE